MYNVDFVARTCTCRKWQLTGIPCLHSVSALVRAKEDPNLFVDDCYTVDRYVEVYETAIYGINGADLWDDSFYIPPFPPGFGKVKNVGRPQKGRRHGEEEKICKKKKGKRADRFKLSRPKGWAHCGTCGKQGHNKKRCPLNRPGLRTRNQQDGSEDGEELIDAAEEEGFVGEDNADVNGEENGNENVGADGDGPKVMMVMRHKVMMVMICLINLVTLMMTCLYPS